jgi:hypothetical protein
MPENSTGFLEENPGEKSGMRLFCFLTVVTILGVYIASNIYHDIVTTLTLKKVSSMGDITTQIGAINNILKDFQMLDFPPMALYALILAIFGKLAQKLLENMDSIINSLTVFKYGPKNVPSDKPQEDVQPK